MMEKAEIRKRGQTCCVTGVPNDVYLSKRIMHIHLPVLIVEPYEHILLVKSVEDG